MRSCLHCWNSIRACCGPASSFLLSGVSSASAFVFRSLYAVFLVVGSVRIFRVADCLSFSDLCSFGAAWCLAGCKCPTLILRQIVFPVIF